MIRLFKFGLSKKLRKDYKLELLYEAQKSILYDTDYFTEMILWKFSGSGYCNKFSELLNKCSFD